MMQYLVAIIAFPLLLVGWVLVQQASRRFAKSHPEFGPAREEGGGLWHELWLPFQKNLQEKRADEKAEIVLSICLSDHY